MLQDLIRVGAALAATTVMVESVASEREQTPRPAPTASVSAPPLRPSADAGGWHQWRGPLNTGMAHGDAPLTWDDRSNIDWKIEIPGRGHSTPVVSGSRLFLTTAVPTGKGSASAAGRASGGADAGMEHRFEVMAIDRDSGRIAWRRTATVATPHEGYHRVYGSFASNSPVTDGTPRLRLLRIARLVCLRPRRRAAVAERLRRQNADGHGVRRGHAADAARWTAAAALRPPGPRLPRDARRCDRQGNLAGEADRALQLGRALCRRTCRPASDRHERAQRPRL